MKVKLTSHFQKLHFLQNFWQVLLKSITATLRKLSNICRELLYHMSMRRENIIDADQNPLLICDVFGGQKAEAVTSLLQERKILKKYVPNNMTDYFQVIDLTANKWAKEFMKQKLDEWFATQLRNELENTTIKILLSTMKTLHVGSLIKFCNQLTSSHGKQIILAGWRIPGKSAPLQDG